MVLPPKSVRRVLSLLQALGCSLFLTVNGGNAQTLLGPAGGFESSFTVDNTTLATAGAADTWLKANANQTISLETTTVRSGSGSLRILNTSTAGRRVYSPLLASVADGSRLVLQYYRRRPSGTGQEEQRGIAFPSESLSGTYGSATSADTWEKTTYVPTATTTAGDKWAVIMHRLVSGGDNTLPEYIDDVAVYVASSVDNVVPDAPTSPVVSPASTTSLAVSWTAPVTGVDGGGYLVVRGTSDPATAPNVNGVYAYSNNIAAGQTVVHAGNNTSFTDTNLLTGTNYFYRIYTVDKAFNYSSSINATGMPTPPGAPVITAQPIDQAVVAGTNATFSVTATGAPPLYYQWQHASTNLPGATNSTLTISNVTAAQTGTYQVIVSNAVGSATSDPASLTIIQNIFSVLTYNVMGNFAADWTTNAAQVRAIGRQVVYLNPDIITFNEIPRQYTGEMTNFVTAFLPGYYMATNSSSDGFIRSVICSRYPINRSTSYFGTLATGSSLTNFGYDGNFTRDLFEAEINVPNFSQPLHVFTMHLKSGQTTDDTAKRAAESAVVSNYFVTAYLTTNSSHPYLITGDWNEDSTRPPPGTPKVIPNLTNAAVGFRLTTPVNPVTGSDMTHSIQSASLSHRYDYILPNGLLYSNIVSSQVFRTDLLTNPPAPLLTNDDVTASDHLPVMMVFNNPFAASAPSIFAQPQNQTNVVGSSVMFTVLANGTQPLSYQWQRSGTNLINGGNISGATSATLTVSPVASTDVSSYAVIITNAIGAVTSVVTTLTIAVPPSVVTQPQSQTNSLGGTAVFSVAVSGSAPFSYQWKKGGALLSDGGNVSGATSDTLTLSNLISGDATNYSVVITNIAGSVTSSVATLTILLPPSITTQPVGRTVLQGDPFILSVAATGASPLAYQWQSNGVAISGAAFDNYTNASAVAAAGYTVIVSNQVGVVTSSVANVIVALAAAPFYPGNLVVLRAGDGVQTLGAGGNSIYIDQYTTNGIRLSTIGIPDTNANSTLIAPNSTSEGWLSRSANGLAFTIAGYNTNRHAVASLSGSTASVVPRVVGVLNVSGQYSIGGRTLSQYSTGNIRSGVTDGSNNFWGAGSVSGTYYFGSNAAAATVQNSVANTRVLNAFNGGLYFSAGSGTRGIYALAGFPTSSATPANIISTGGTSSPYDFAINPGGTIAYVADDSSVAAGGGIQKWTNNVGAWSLAYTLTNAGSARGLAVDFDGANAVIYATTTETSSNRLVRLVDTGESAISTTLASAGNSQVFRGLDFSTTSSINLRCRITDVSPTSSNTIQASITGAPHYQYIVQYNTNLTGNWMNLATNVTDATGQWTFTDAQTTNSTRCYRVIWQW